MSLGKICTCSINKKYVTSNSTKIFTISHALVYLKCLRTNSGCFLDLIHVTHHKNSQFRRIRKLCNKTSMYTIGLQMFHHHDNGFNSQNMSAIDLISS